MKFKYMKSIKVISDTPSEHELSDFLRLVNNEPHLQAALGLAHLNLTYHECLFIAATAAINVTMSVNRSVGQSVGLLVRLSVCH